MVRRFVCVAGALTALLLAIAFVYLFQQQRQQAQDLVRLNACVSTLERNQVTPTKDLIMGCPID